MNSKKWKHKISQIKNLDSGSYIFACTEDVLCLAESKNWTTRLAALKVLEQISRQGLYIPDLIIPVIVSLEADVIKCIKEKAHALNKFNENRHHAIFVSNAAKGMIKSYTLLKKCTGKYNISVLYGNNICHFTEFYCKIIGVKLKKNERKSFLQSLLREITKDFKEARNQEDKCIDHLYFIKYMCELLAYLPYAHLYEVVQVIASISTFIDANGDEIVGCLKGKFGGDSDSDDEDFGTVFTSNDFSILESATKAAGIYFLIQTKQYLQEAYGVTNKKIEEFINDGDKSFQRSCSSLHITRITLNDFAEVALQVVSIKNDNRKEQIGKDLCKRFCSKLREHMHQLIDVKPIAARTSPKKKSPERTADATKKTSPNSGKRKRSTKRKPKSRRIHVDSDEEDDESDGWVSGDPDNDKDDIDSPVSKHSDSESSPLSKTPVISRKSIRKRRRRSSNL